MIALTKVSLFSSFVLMLAISAKCEQPAESKTMITISYGKEGEAPLFAYKLKAQGDLSISCELVANGKTLSQQSLKGCPPLGVLANELLKDFATTETQLGSDSKESSVGKSLAIQVCGSGLCRTMTVSGSDALLTEMISKSKAARDLFGQLSADQPKMYRLWDDPGPLKAMLPDPGGARPDK
jgi:hypothetical protein